MRFTNNLLITLQIGWLLSIAYIPNVGAQVTLNEDDIFIQDRTQDNQLLIDADGLKFGLEGEERLNGTILSNPFELQIQTGVNQPRLSINSVEDVTLRAGDVMTFFSKNNFSFFFEDFNRAPLFMTVEGDNRPRVKMNGPENNGQAGVLEISDDEANHRMLFDGNEIDGMGGLVLNNNTDENVHIVTGGGLVGINTFSPSATLSVNGSANKIGGGSWSVFSDIRLKKNIAPFTDGLEKILQIQPKRFQYNGSMALAPDDGKEYIGVIAQEMEAIAPYMISPLTYPEECNEYLQYDGSALPYLLVNAVKTLYNQVQALQMELKYVQKQLDSSRQPNRLNH